MSTKQHVLEKFQVIKNSAVLKYVLAIKLKKVIANMAVLKIVMVLEVEKYMNMEPMEER